MLLGPQPGINPGTCLLSHRRHSGNFLGPKCSVKGVIVSRPSTVYHLVFTPYSPFLTVSRLKSFSRPWRCKVHNRPHKQVPLLHTIYDVCNDQCQACILFAMPNNFFPPRSLTNENIHLDVDENLWPNPQNRVDKKHKVQWGTLQLTFYCRPIVLFLIQVFFFFFLPVWSWLFHQ